MQTMLDKGLIAESGIDWRPKKHTKIPTKSASYFFLKGGCDPPPPTHTLPQKIASYKYLPEYAFLWKNTRMENCSSENFLMNDLFDI